MAYTNHWEMGLLRKHSLLQRIQTVKPLCLQICMPAVCTILLLLTYLFYSYNQKTQFLKKIGMGMSHLMGGGVSKGLLVCFLKITPLPYCSCTSSAKWVPSILFLLIQILEWQGTGTQAKFFCFLKSWNWHWLFFFKLTRAAAKLPFVISKLWWILCCVKWKPVHMWKMENSHHHPQPDVCGL